MLKRVQTIVGAALVGYCSPYISIEVICFIAVLFKLWVDLRKVPKICESMDDIGNRTIDMLGVLSPIKPVTKMPTKSNTKFTDATETNHQEFNSTPNVKKSN